MARVELRAGAVIDTISSEEMGAHLRDLAAALGAGKREPDVLAPQARLVTDASGNLPAGGGLGRLYEVPLGMIAIIHRINVEAAGYTRSAPLTAGWIAFAVDSPTQGGTVVGLPAGSSAVVPATIVDSLSAAVIVKGGQTFGAYGTGLPASTAFTFRLQVVLKETEGRT